MSGLFAQLNVKKLKKMDWSDLQRLGQELGCPPLYYSNKVFKERLLGHIEVRLTEETTKSSKGGSNQDLWSAKNEMKWGGSLKKKPPPPSERKEVSSSSKIKGAASNQATRTVKPPANPKQAKPKSVKKKNLPPPRPVSKKKPVDSAEKKKPTNGIIKSSLKSSTKGTSTSSKFCKPVMFCGSGLGDVDDTEEEKKDSSEKEKEKARPPAGKKDFLGQDHITSGPLQVDHLRSRNISKRLPEFEAHKIHPLKMQIEKPNIKHFDLLKEIGAGAFGKVYQVKHIQSGKIYAMKVLKKKKIVERNQVEHTRTERLVLNLSRHPFCVTLRCAFQTKQKLYFVMDFYRGGELFFHLQKQQRFKEETVKLMVAEVTLALGHLHNVDIIYRDLKPENILIDQDGHLALTDFGMTKRLKKGEATKTFCGTPEYLAPEVIKGLPYDKNVDWWSVGILCYELAVGIPPFYSAQSLNEMYRKIQYAKLSWRRRDKYLSKELMDFVAQLLDRNPKTRLGTSSEDGAEVVSHDFFETLDLDAVMNKEIVPKFKPRFKGGKENIKDTSNFDAVKKVKETVYKNDERKLQSSVDHFVGFTYKPDVFLGGGV